MYFWCLIFISDAYGNEVDNEGMIGLYSCVVCINMCHKLKYVIISVCRST